MQDRPRCPTLAAGLAGCPSCHSTQRPQSCPHFAGQPLPLHTPLPIPEPQPPILSSPAACPAWHEPVRLTGGKAACPFLQGCLFQSGRVCWQRARRCSHIPWDRLWLFLPGVVRAQRVVAHQGYAVACCPVLICPRQANAGSARDRPRYAQRGPVQGTGELLCPECLQLPAAQGGLGWQPPAAGDGQAGPGCVPRLGPLVRQGVCTVGAGSGRARKPGLSSTLPVAEALQPTSWCLLVGCLLAASAWLDPRCAGTR